MLDSTVLNSWFKYVKKIAKLVKFQKKKIILDLLNFRIQMGEFLAIAISSKPQKFEMVKENQLEERLVCKKSMSSPIFGINIK